LLKLFLLGAGMVVGFLLARALYMRPAEDAEDE